MTGTTTHLTNKSLKLMEAEKRLRELEANIANDRKRREIELKSALEQVRKETAAIKNQLNAPLSQPPMVSTIKVETPKTSNIRYPKDLPEPALFLLKELWFDLGYRDQGFVEMQMEISKELDRADFARFEREMICNELISARTEIQMLKDERNQLIQRLELNRQNIDQLMKTEERTYQTLISERTQSNNQIQDLTNQINQIKSEGDQIKQDFNKLDNQFQNQQKQWSEKVNKLETQLQKEEKSKIALTLYLKTLEDRLKLETLNKIGYDNITTSILGSSSSSHQSNQNYQSIWSNMIDDETLKAKLNQRKLVLDEERKLIEQENQLKTELNKLESQRLNLLNSNLKPHEFEKEKEKSEKTQQKSDQNSNSNTKENQKSNDNQENDKKKTKNNNSNNKKDEPEDNKNKNKKDESEDNKNKNKKKQQKQEEEDKQREKTRKEKIMDLF